MSRALRPALGCALVMLAGCSGKTEDGGASPSSGLPDGSRKTEDGGTSPSSGLPGSSRISELSDAQLRQFCDWSAAKQGGYGMSHDCPGGMVHTYASQEECVTRTQAGAARPSCSATVADVEACMTALANDPCDVAAPECSALLNCAV